MSVSEPRQPTAADDAAARHRTRVTPGRLTLATVVFLLLVGGAILLIDMFEVGGLGAGLDAPVWVLIYREGFALDFLHWTVLAVGALLASHLSGRLRAGGDRRLAAFWALVAVTLLLLLINEAGTPLHFFGTVAAQLAGVSPLWTRSGIVVVIGLVALYALVRHGRHAWAFRPARGYLVAAFGVYAAAVVMGVTGWKWYVPVGARLDLWLFRHRLPRDDLPGVLHEMQVMEVMVQRSAELLAAALFLALTLAFRAHPRVRARADEPASR